MTTTTPESRATIAYVSYHRTLAGGPGHPITCPAFSELGPADRTAWRTAAEVVWSKAKQGQSRGDVVSMSPRPSGMALDTSAWASAAGVLWDLAVTGTATI